MWIAEELALIINLFYTTTLSEVVKQETLKLKIEKYNIELKRKVYAWDCDKTD